MAGQIRCWAAAVTTVGLLATGCAETSSSATGAGGDGVEVGASKTVYQAAFEDVSPITLRTQSVAPKGSLTGARYEHYAAALEEWSGGKITVEMEYSSAVATPLEWDDALSDGRLDFGPVAPLYEPSEYPLNDQLVSLLFLGSQLPESGYLETLGWSNQVGLESDELQAEYRDHGMQVLLPAFSSGSTGLFCTEAGTGLDDLAGRQVSVGSTTLGRQVEALGMTPVSIDYTELFESLQRDVIDCAATAPLTVGDAGAIPAAPNLTVDPTAGFTQQAISFAFSDATWQSLPLVARQLMFDRLDVFVEDTLRATWGQMATYVALADDEGGEIGALDHDARDRLVKENDAIVSDVRDDGGEQLVTAALAAVEDWAGRVDGLGFTTDVDYVDFAASYDESALDLDGYLDALLGDALSAHRPR